MSTPTTHLARPRPTSPGEVDKTISPRPRPRPLSYGGGEVAGEVKSSSERPRSRTRSGEVAGEVNTTTNHHERSAP